jgi:hypothetical protein
VLSQSLQDVPATVEEDLEQAGALFQQQRDLRSQLRVLVLKAHVIRLGPRKEEAARDAAALLTQVVTGEAVDARFGEVPPYWATEPVVAALRELQVLTPQLGRTPEACLPPASRTAAPLACITRAADLAGRSGLVGLQRWTRQQYYFQVMNLVKPDAGEYRAALTWWNQAYDEARSGLAREQTERLRDEVVRAAVKLSEAALFAPEAQFAIVQQTLNIASRQDAPALARRLLQDEKAIDPTLELERQLLLAAALVNQAATADVSQRSQLLQKAWRYLEPLPDADADSLTVRNSFSQANLRVDTLYLSLIELVRGQFFELQSQVLPARRALYQGWAQKSYQGVLDWFTGPKQSYLESKGWLVPLRDHAGNRLHALQSASARGVGTDPRDVLPFPPAHL